MKYRKRSFSRFRVIFAGSADWSINFLDLLLKQNFKVVGVLIAPDKKRNRGQKIVCSSIKKFALKQNLKVLQPESLREDIFLKEFKKLRPDFVFVASYGKIFPENLLQIPPFGFINFHPSLLPEFRGPSPIQSAILSGKGRTGISFMRLAKGMDDGPILFQKEVRIEPLETSVSLTEKLVSQGEKHSIDLLKEYLTGDSFTLKKQKSRGVSFSKIFRKEEGKIDWEKESAEEIDRKIRALNPQIKTFCFYQKDEKRKRILLSYSSGFAKDFNLNYGEYKLLSEEGGEVLAIKSKEGVVLIPKIQVEGKKECLAKDFFQGYPEGRMF